MPSHCARRRRRTELDVVLRDDLRLAGVAPAERPGELLGFVGGVHRLDVVALDDRVAHPELDPEQERRGGDDRDRLRLVHVRVGVADQRLAREPPRIGDFRLDDAVHAQAAEALHLELAGHERGDAIGHHHVESIQEGHIEVSRLYCVRGVADGTTIVK